MSPRLDPAENVATGWPSITPVSVCDTARAGPVPAFAITRLEDMVVNALMVSTEPSTARLDAYSVPAMRTLDAYVSPYSGPATVVH